MDDQQAREHVRQAVWALLRSPAPRKLAFVRTTFVLPMPSPKSAFKRETDLFAWYHQRYVIGCTSMQSSFPEHADSFMAPDRLALLQPQPALIIGAAVTATAGALIGDAGVSAAETISDHFQIIVETRNLAASDPPGMLDKWKTEVMGPSWSRTILTRVVPTIVRRGSIASVLVRADAPEHIAVLYDDLRRGEGALTIDAVLFGCYIAAGAVSEVERLLAEPDLVPSNA